MSKKKDNLVKVSNSLVRSSWTMDSIWEARLVALVASKTRVGDIDFKEHEIPISEILEGVDIQRSGQIYDLIEKAAKKMVSKIITIREPNGATIIAGVFAQCRIDPGTGIIQVAFAPALKPHYLQLSKNFTKYKIEEFLQLPSTYSQRLFEILMSWRNIPDGEVTISMSELHEQLDTPPSYRANFKAFRLFVLEQAHRDIRANPDSSLDYEWQAVKQGRKVIAVRFVFDKKKIEAVRRARFDEAMNTLQPVAQECSIKMAGLSEADQDRMQREQKQAVCDLCKSRGIAKENLFPLECKRYAKIEILNEDGSPMTTVEAEFSEPVREPEKSSNEQILEAYLKATDGRFNELRFISEVHRYLPNITREELGKHLLQMQRGKKCVLNYYGNPGTLPKVDKESPIMCGETPRHTIFIEEEN